MDNFVSEKLAEWRLNEWIKSFKEEEIDEESFNLLEDEEIPNLISKVGPRLKFKRAFHLFKEEQSAENLEKDDSSMEAGPSFHNTTDKGKRKLDRPDESSKSQALANKRPRHTVPGSFSEDIAALKKDQLNLHTQDEKAQLIEMLRENLKDLETNKRELIGVFGKTGAGKSSLINAIIGEENLLPSGMFSACTSVMIKVEADMNNTNYTAEIEFMKKEAWNSELLLWEKKSNDRDFEEKLSAVYGEQWKDKSDDDLMMENNFTEIKEFLKGERKILTHDSAGELSADLVKYTKTDPKDEKRRYWPLVKCVTVRVPKNSLLQCATLVDLPGNGDHNKSRDEMWKEVVGNCSIAWIVTEMNRAAAEKEAWDILESACSLMGNGGQCQQIHFICTKSDHIHKKNSEDFCALVKKGNDEIKDQVREKFSRLPKVTKHFSDESFKVFTVSSEEFFRQKLQTQDQTEIPKLRELLHNLNDNYLETLINSLNGCCSLLKAIEHKDVVDKTTDVCTDLEDNLKREVAKLSRSMDEVHDIFDKCLSDGVEQSKSSCATILQKFLNSESGRGFHRTLSCVVRKHGFHVQKTGVQMNLNEILASKLTDSIDVEFKKAFPNEGKGGPIFRAISEFSLDIKRLIQKYRDADTQLEFLIIEGEQIKTKLYSTIRLRKKEIYQSLEDTIKEAMIECYEEAAQYSGDGKLQRMKDILEEHVRTSRDTMFHRAKDEMLRQLKVLKDEILYTVNNTMKDSIQLTLKTDHDSLPGGETAEA